MKFSLPLRPLNWKSTVNQKVVVSAVFVAAMFMNIMDGTVVNVALPMLSRYFAMSPAQTANMATVTAAETGHASTLQNTVRQAGAADRIPEAA